jgi:type I restriction enzyme S subunit
MSDVLLRELLGSRGITYGVVKPGDNTPGGVPLLKAADVGNGRVNINPSFRISPDKNQEHCRTELTGGELLLTLVGTPGQCAIAPHEVKGFNVVRAVGVFMVKQGVSARYVMYAIQSPSSQNYILNICNTTVQATLNLGDLKGLPLRVPPLPEQKAIANILGTLDDKIELNRKTNETLEAMAKALFKSWFVDFDPVRAKAEGRPTGLPAEISDLFPDSFEDSELGEIPNGWNVVEFGNLYTIGKGGIWGDDTCSGEEFIEVSCLRGIDCHNLASGTIPVVPSRWVKRSQIESRIPEDGAILIEGSGSFCGRSLLWEEKYLKLFERPVVYSNFCKRLTPTCSKVYTPVAWMALRDCYDSNEVANFRTGTAFPNLDTSGLLKGISIVLPSEGVAAAFQDSYYLRNRVDLMVQSFLLSNIRDALLPKLISGEIRIPDAEKILEEVGV